MKDLNAMAKRIYEQNKAVGWWDDPNRCIYTTIQLINTEISEATEGERKDLMDDHLPHRKMGEVELADALIRVLDLAGRMSINIRAEDGTIAAIQTVPAFNKNIYTAHLHLTAQACNLGMTVTESYDYLDVDIDSAFNHLISSLVAVSSLYGYDVWGAMEEKLEYNKNRQDHKRENRMKENGKKV